MLTKSILLSASRAFTVASAGAVVLISFALDPGVRGAVQHSIIDTLREIDLAQFLDASIGAERIARIGGIAIGSVSILLFGYASVCALRLLFRAHHSSRQRRFETLLDKLRVDINSVSSTEEFGPVATRALSAFAHFFGADQFKLESIDPITGATGVQFASRQAPPPVAPEVKADFLSKVCPLHEAIGSRPCHFVDLSNMKTGSPRRGTTADVAVGVSTPLGRVAVLNLTYSRPRRTFREGEIALLRDGLSALIQMSVNHCKRREREDLEKRVKHAERLETVGTLVSGIAHEFNNILGVILGYGELSLRLADGGADPMRRYVQEILTTSKRGEHIVSQILTLSREREQERRPFSLDEAITDALTLLSVSLPDLQVRCSLPSEGVVVLGHPVEIQQIIMNLCKNAFEASVASARVNIEVTILQVEGVRSLSLGLLQPGEYVRIGVADTGKGIAPEELPHIFEPFFTTRDSSGGTGLGLAAVNSLVTGMGGCIDVASELGNGTCFDLYFPRSTLAPFPTHQFIPAERVPLGDGQLIAILDRDVHDLAMCEEKVAALGYEPVGFSDVGRMKESLAEQAADFIIIDALSIPPHYSPRDIELSTHGTPFVLVSRSGRIQSADPLNAAQLRKPLCSKALAQTIAGELRRQSELTPQRSLAIHERRRRL